MSNVNRSRRATRRPTVAIAGGGVAALEAMYALRAAAEEQVEIEVIAPEPHFWYRPLAVVEPFGAPPPPRFELVALAADAGATVTLAAATSVDVAERRLTLASGAELEYSALVVATGTRAVPAIEGALTFRGPADVGLFGRALTDIEAGAGDHLVFASPSRATWTLPLYELALLTDRWLHQRGIRDQLRLTIVTPEERALLVFGAHVADAVEEALANRGISVLAGVHAGSFADGRLSLVPNATLDASHVVALPELVANAPDGLPRGWGGFIPVDEFGRVVGASDVYAAGDVTTVAIKQGGIAAQQAATAAATVAADLGFASLPPPFRPTLRGVLLTGELPRYLRTDLATAAGIVDTDPLWWPPAKIAGHHLAPHLALHATADEVESNMEP
jgi:sulfide:quinone oxidoreductase